MNYKLPNNKELRIAISGQSGCGNTTVSTILSERLNIKMINFTFRSLVDEVGLTLPEIIERARTDEFYDRTVDSRQVELAKKESCVLGSRLAIWMLKEADLKVYLLASTEVRAKRIQDREGGNLESITSFTKLRDAEDTARYKKLYNIDNKNFSFVDLEIDTSSYTPEQIADIILEKLFSKGLIISK